MVILFFFVVISIVVFCIATMTAAIIDYETTSYDDDDDDFRGFLSSEAFEDITDFKYWRWGLISVVVLWLVLFLITLVGRCIDWSVYAGVHCGRYTSRAFCCWLFCGESFCRDCEGNSRKSHDRNDGETHYHFHYGEEVGEEHDHKIRRWSSTTKTEETKPPGQLV